MFRVGDKNEIIINEGDFGITLPIKFSNIPDNDRIIFKIKEKNEEENEILRLNFTVENGEISFMLTEEQSQLLNRGKYLYDVFQYEENVLKNTISVDTLFIVEEGA